MLEVRASTDELGAGGGGGVGDTHNSAHNIVGGNRDAHVEMLCFILYQTGSSLRQAPQEGDPLYLL